MAGDDELVLDGVRRMEGSRLGYGISVVAAVGSVAAAVAAGLTARSPNAFGAIVGILMLPFFGGLLGAWWHTRVGKKPSERACELRLTSSDVRLDGEQLIARADIGSAVVWPARSQGTIVRIVPKGRARGVIDLQVKSLDDGRAFVRALRQGGSQTAHRFRIAATSSGSYRKRVLTFALGAPALLLLLALVGGFTGGGTGFGWFAALLGLTYVAQTYQLVSSARIAVGTDGLSLSWLWTKSFIPMSEVLRAERVDGPASWTGYYPSLVRIHLRSGPPVDVVASLVRTTSDGPAGKWEHLASMDADMIVERIGEAVADRAPAGGAELADWESEILARGERELSAWVAALRSLHTRVESFRQQAGGGIEALWGVLEDSAAEPERRAAAAVALSPHLDEGGRARVRIAAQATVAPKLRIALEAAAEDDDDALAAALEEVSETSSLRARTQSGT